MRTDAGDQPGSALSFGLGGLGWIESIDHLPGLSRGDERDGFISPELDSKKARAPAAARRFVPAARLDREAELGHLPSVEREFGCPIAERQPERGYVVTDAELKAIGRSREGITLGMRPIDGSVVPPEVNGGAEREGQWATAADLSIGHAGRILQMRHHQPFFEMDTAHVESPNWEPRGELEVGQVSGTTSEGCVLRMFQSQGGARSVGESDTLGAMVEHHGPAEGRGAARRSINRGSGGLHIRPPYPTHSRPGRSLPAIHAAETTAGFPRSLSVSAVSLLFGFPVAWGEQTGGPARDAPCVIAHDSNWRHASAAVFWAFARPNQGPVGRLSREGPARARSAGQFACRARGLSIAAALPRLNHQSARGRRRDPMWLRRPGSVTADARGEASGDRHARPYASA